MDATLPPTENMLSLRAAVLDLARHRLAPLYEGDAPDRLDALPAWLWSLPAHQITRLLDKEPAALADALADAINAETARRHPTEQFFAHLERHHPHLSHVQRARLAEFASALIELRFYEGEVTAQAMAARGFTHRERESYKQPALDLITSLQHQEAVAEDKSLRPTPAGRLREAGTRAHARRAFADGGIEADAIAASRPTCYAPPFPAPVR